MHSVRDALQRGSVISTVNLAEVRAKPKGGGLALRHIMERLRALGLEATAFTEEDTRVSGEMVSTTQPLGRIRD